MNPINADYLVSVQNPICDWEEYQIIVKDNGSSEWWLIMKDPDTMEPMHWELVPPVNENPYL